MKIVDDRKSDKVPILEMRGGETFMCDNGFLWIRINADRAWAVSLEDGRDWSGGLWPVTKVNAKVVIE